MQNWIRLFKIHLNCFIVINFYKMNNEVTNLRLRFALKARMLILLLIPVSVQCQTKPFNPWSYDLDSPVVIQLSKELKEISGIIMKGSSLYAITDNTGQLFQLDTANGKILAHWQFGKVADYEDVAIAEGRFYVLNSNGDIISFLLTVDGKSDIKEFNFPYGKGNEFEILYYDEIAKQLVVVCKECKDDKKKALTVYTIDHITGKYESADFDVNAQEVAQKTNNKMERLKPSAAAVHPQTGEIYMVSSINKMLIRLSRNGKVLSVSSLKRSLFEQPEGIAFTVGGDLLISNEAGEKDQATLLLFKNKIKQ